MVGSLGPGTTHPAGEGGLRRFRAPDCVPDALPALHLGYNPNCHLRSHPVGSFSNISSNAWGTQAPGQFCCSFKDRQLGRGGLGCLGVWTTHLASLTHGFLICKGIVATLVLLQNREHSGLRAEKRLEHGGPVWAWSTGWLQGKKASQQGQLPRHAETQRRGGWSSAEGQSLRGSLLRESQSKTQETLQRKK